MIDNGAAGSTLSFASVLTHSDNRAYLASCLRHFAQICSPVAPQTSDIPETLYEILGRLTLIIKHRLKSMPEKDTKREI